MAEPLTAKRNRSKAVESASATKQQAFLEAFAESGNVRLSAFRAGIDRSTHYDWLKNDPYRKAFQDAEAQAVDLLEQEARRRALEGWEEPVFYKGEVAGAIRRYDSTLLIFLLKGLRPEKYREQHEVQHTGDVTFTLQIPKPGAKE